MKRNTLDNLNVDRFLYKQVGNVPSTQNSLLSGASSPNIPISLLSYSANNKNQQGDGSVAIGVANGSVLTSSLFQTSQQPDRIELDPLSNAIVLYRNDKIYGAWYPGSTTASTPIPGQFLTAVAMEVLATLNYGGIAQPQINGAGVVVGGAAGTVFPSGWSVVHTSTGVYTLTHNLNTLNYGVVPATSTGSSISATLNGVNLNTFVINTRNTITGALADSDFSFICFSNPVPTLS